jgi:hypothetical protein
VEERICLVLDRHDSGGDGRCGGQSGVAFLFLAGRGGGKGGVKRALSTSSASVDGRAHRR